MKSCRSSRSGSKDPKTTGGAFSPRASHGRSLCCRIEPHDHFQKADPQVCCQEKEGDARGAVDQVPRMLRDDPSSGHRGEPACLPEMRASLSDGGPRADHHAGGRGDLRGGGCGHVGGRSPGIQGGGHLRGAPPDLPEEDGSRGRRHHRWRTDGRHARWIGRHGFFLPRSHHGIGGG